MESSFRILWVDNDPYALSRLKAALPAGFEVLAAANPSTLKKLIAGQPMDLTLVDPWQDEHGKLTFQSWLLDADLPKPFVVLTTIHDPEKNRMLQDVGAIEFLSKSEEVYSNLETICRRLIRDTRLLPQDPSELLNLVILLDRDLCIRSFNTSARNHFRALNGRELAVGLPASDFLIAENVAFLQEVIGNAAKADREQWNFAMPVPLGGRQWLEISINLLYGDGYQVSGICLMIQDLSQSQQTQETLHQREATLRALMDSSPGVIILIDPKGKILAANQTASDWFGKSSPELIGLSVYDYLNPSLRVITPQNIDTVRKTGRPVILDDLAQGRYLRSHILPVINDAGDVYQLAVYLVDITKGKQAEAIYQKRDAILQAVNYASEQFLQAASWRARIQEVLKRWTEATAVSRVLIYKHEVDASGMRFLSLQYGWDYSSGSPTEVPEDYRYFSMKDAGLSDWEVELQRGEIVQVKIPEPDDALYGIFEQTQTKSLLLVPVMLDDKLWGQIDFVDTVVKRDWTVSERDAVKTAANILSAALRRERDELSRAALLDAMPDLMFIFDRHGIYIDYHAQDPELLALPPDQLLGKSMYEALPLSVAELAFNAFEKTVLTGTPQLFEYELPIKNARYWEGRMVRSGDGAVAVIRDITKRRRFEEELRLSEKSIGDLYEITSSNELNFDEKQHALLKMGCQRYGMEIGYILQLKKDFFELMHFYTSVEGFQTVPTYALDQSYSYAVIQQNRPVMIEEVIGTQWEQLAAYRDYHLRSLIGAPLMVGDKLFGVLSFSSKQPREKSFTQAEARFLHLMAQWIGLERERNQYLAQLHQNSEDLLNKSLELAAARDQALELSRMKSDFLATMSHEIRTPMNAVIGMNELLLNTALDAQQREYAETVRDSARLLLSLLNNTLDFTKIEAGMLKLQHVRFDPQKTFEDVAAMFSQQAQQKKLEFNLFISPQIPHFLRGDPVRFSQVIINLVSNAIRFTHHGSVMVWSEVLTETDDVIELLVKVRDTGIGLSASIRERLFQPFAQADGKGQQSGGSGLGLTISKRLTEMLGGSLNYESIEGDGSVFWFTARFERDAKSQIVQIEKPVLSRLAGEKLLVFESLPEARDLWERYLNGWEIPYEVVDAPEQVIESLKLGLDGKRKYAGCILDYEGMRCMGGRTCVQVMELLRATRTPVIIVTRQNSRMRPQHNPPAEVFAGKLVRPFSRRDVERLLPGFYAQNLTEAVLASQACQPEPPPAKKEKPLFEKLVLLAEDNPANQHLTVAQLQSLGYRVVVVSTGTQVVNELAQHYQDYGLVLMDLQMPEMDGYQATQLIRKAESVINRHIPIIAMTASVMLEDRQQCLDAGMDDYISKPVLMDDIRRAIARCLAHEDAAKTGKATATTQAAQTEILDPRVVADLRSLNRPDEPDFFRQLVGIYMVDSRQVMQRIRAEMDSGNQADLQKAVHSLKGISANLGAVRLANLCGQIENQLRSGEPLVSGWLEALEILYARTCEDLKWESLNKTETT